MERPPSAAGAATPAAASTPAAPRVSTALPRFLRTHTSEQQRELELKVADLYADLTESEPGAERDELLVLLRDRHTRYLQGGLGQLPGGFISLDASRPWIVYWVLHGLALLQAPLPHDISGQQVVAFLSSCQHPQGGYGGGPGQLAHLAPTYAAVGALVTLGTQEALASIDRPAMWGFLNRMAIAPEQGGGFRMHDGGESDVRSCYTAMAVASHLCLDVAALAAKAGLVDYIRRCQTYEGGIGGEPGNEAHGGYTFCGLAALCLAGAPHALDLQRLLRWAAQRQGWVEGGFNGRTNKLVDGCYSFWQGGVFQLLQQLLEQQQQQQGAAGGQGVPPHLDVRCVSTTYPPQEAPSSWPAHEQQQQQQQQPFVVPDLPDLSGVTGPVERADQAAQQLNALCDALAAAALEQTDAAAAGRGDGDADGSGSGGGGGGGLAAQAHRDAQEPDARQQLLQRAQAAQEAAERAEDAAHIAAASAAVLYPCGPAGSAPDTPEAAAASNPCFNARALQCWVLRACQQLKGGLRDKPGKSADYYHTCYCLSGLTAAQHMQGGGVLGPAVGAGRAPPAAGDAASASGSRGPRGVPPSKSNELAAADPLLNVVVDRLAAAQAFFRAAAVFQDGGAGCGS